MIECRGVSFSYDGAVPALDGVDLNIEDGEFFCILGGNGSGKSTFAKHLNALLKPDVARCVSTAWMRPTPSWSTTFVRPRAWYSRIPMTSWWQRLSKMTLRLVPKTLACHRRKLHSAYARR